jgi:hypothetical protein
MNLRANFAPSLGLLGFLRLMLPRTLRADTLYTHIGKDFTNCTDIYCIGGPYHVSITLRTR